MRPAIRYTLARVTLFLVCLLAGWLLGVRDDPLLLVLGAAVVSMFLSIVVLRGMRNEFSRDVAARVESRTHRGDEVEDRILDDQADGDGFVAEAPRQTPGQR